MSETNNEVTDRFAERKRDCSIMLVEIHEKTMHIEPTSWANVAMLQRLERDLRIMQEYACNE